MTSSVLVFYRLVIIIPAPRVTKEKKFTSAGIILHHKTLDSWRLAQIPFFVFFNLRDLSVRTSPNTQPLNARKIKVDSGCLVFGGDLLRRAKELKSKGK